MTKDYCGTSEKYGKPLVIEVLSPNYSSRNGQRITHIILHYTTSRNVKGTLSWFKTPGSRVSAHYVIDRNGDIYQCVKDDSKAWHARKANSYSIGIEHVAGSGDVLTKEQEDSSARLINYLVNEYKIDLENIVGHGHIAGNITLCPGHIFGEATENALRKWVDENIHRA